MTYTCAFCNTEYSDPKKRMDCEKKCYETMKKREEEDKAVALAKEREARYAEIKKLSDELSEKITQFCKDYSEIYISGRDWFKFYKLFL